MCTLINSALSNDTARPMDSHVNEVLSTYLKIRTEAPGLRLSALHEFSLFVPYVSSDNPAILQVVTEAVEDMIKTEDYGYEFVIIWLKFRQQTTSVEGVREQIDGKCSDLIKLLIQNLLCALEYVEVNNSTDLPDEITRTSPLIRLYHTNQKFVVSVLQQADAAIKQTSPNNVPDLISLAVYLYDLYSDEPFN